MALPGLTLKCFGQVIQKQDNDLHQSFIVEAGIAGVTKNNMVYHGYIKHTAGILQFLGKLNIGLAGGGAAAGVVMHQNNTCRQAFQRRPKNYFWVGYGAAYAAAAYKYFFNNHVGAV